MNDLDYSGILEEFLSVIFSISDKSYQRRVWIQGIGPECEDYDENIMNFFDLSEMILKDPKKYNINDLQLELIKKLCEKYREFSSITDSIDYYMPEKFINFPEWTEITEIAQKILETFNYKYDYAEIQRRFRERNEKLHQ